MKKILILNDAGKKNGNTAALIKTFTEGAESSGKTDEAGKLGANIF
ncbi:MAG: hypothetical protein J5898_05810 [Lachnospiraceae bacterium]|nr:hypothetical protein [Lachnospiraceae bacterium]